MNKQKLQVLILPLVLLVALVSAITWVAGHSRLQLSASDYNQAMPLQTTVITPEGTVLKDTAHRALYTKLVKNGAYTISGEQNNANFIAAVQAKGWLRTTRVDGKLTPESGRAFIAENPGPCIYYVGDRTYSGECDDDAQALKEHLRATADMPSYVDTVSTNQLAGNLKAIVTLKDGSSVALLQDPNGYVDHYIQPVNPDLSVGERRNITVADKNGQYKMAQFKDGFVVYNINGLDILYFASAQTNQQKIEFEGPKDTKLTHKRLLVEGDTLTMTYSMLEGGEQYAGTDNTRNTAPKKLTGKTEVVVWRNNSQQHYYLNDPYAQAAACGSNLICVVNAGSVTVYDVSSKKPKRLYTVPGAEELFGTTAGLRILTKTGVLNFDFEKRIGYLEYTFGPYTYSSIEPAPNGYILCLTDSRANRHALHINPGTNGTDYIDKKILGLYDIKEVKNVSINHNSIYILLNYGDLQYDPGTGLNKPDPKKVQEINSHISDAVKKMGIPSDRYTVVTIGDL